MRTPVQITTISDPGPRCWGIVALADDGTIWVKTINAFDPKQKFENNWRQIESLPQTEQG